jgi:phosphohistidine phosphatase
VADDRLLYVLRHAKSDWTTHARTDFDRPLAHRGERTLGLLADHVRAEGIAPEVVLCSPARRARQTVEGVLPDAEVRFDDELYGATVFELLGVLQRTAPPVTSVLVVGHNPGLHDLVEVLTEEEVDKFPTGGLATLACRRPWSELGPGTAELRGLVRPRELG